MTKNRGRAIKRKATSELERLSMTLDEAFEVTANMTMAEIDEELREMGVDPHALPSLSLARVLSGQGESKSPAYAFVSDDLLRVERATEEVKLLILQLRTMSRQGRYAEALGLAERATVLAPDYWRAWISYGGLLVLTGKLDEGEVILRRTRRDFPDDPKAVAAALHGCAGVREIRCKLNPSGDDLRAVLRLYEEALEFDGSRANTRACLVINSFLARQISKGKRLFEDSLLCEGFFDAMSLELRERGVRDYGAKMYKIKQALPMWFRNLLDGTGPGHAGSAGVGFAY